jgi:hypothetical protein
MDVSRKRAILSKSLKLDEKDNFTTAAEPGGTRRRSQASLHHW